MISPRRIRVFYLLREGKGCNCIDDGVPRCNRCYGIGIQGGFKKGPLVEIEESYGTVHGVTSLYVRMPTPPLQIGDTFVHKRKRWLVTQLTSVHKDIFVVSYRKVAPYEPFAYFPVEGLTSQSFTDEVPL